MNPKWGVSVIKFARQAPLSLSLKLLECPSLLPHSVLSVCYLCNFTLDQAIVKCLPIVSISHLNWHDNFDIHNFRYTIFLLNPLSFRTDHCGGSHLSLDIKCRNRTYLYLHLQFGEISITNVKYVNCYQYLVPSWKAVRYTPLTPLGRVDQ